MENPGLVPYAARLIALDPVVASPELAAFLQNPQVGPAAKVGVLGELSDGADALVHNFLRLIAGKGRAGQIPGIRDEFQAHIDQGGCPLHGESSLDHVLAPVMQHVHEAAAEALA